MQSTTIAKKFYKDLGIKRFKEIAKEYRVNDDIAFVKRLSKKSDLILDLACGYGRVTIPLAKAGYNVWGIDISKNLILEARRGAKHAGAEVKFDMGNMVKLPYQKAFFDKVFCMWNSFNDLLTTKEQIKTLNEVHRVLKPGGRAFLVLLNGEDKDLQKELKKNGSGKRKRIWRGALRGITFYMYVHDRESIKNLCSKSKFRKYDTVLKNMNGRKRILVRLTK